MEHDITQHGLNVRRDTGATVLLGPVRLVLMTVGTIFLLRIVLQRAGIEVIGLWSVLTIAGAFIALLDAGFSQVLTREVHVGADHRNMTERLLDKQVAAQFYHGALWLVILPVVLVSAWCMPAVPYDRGRFALALVMIACGSVAQIRGRLEAALLAAHQQNAHVQLVDTTGVLLSLSVSLSGALLDMPVEGFAAGALLSACVVWWLLARRIAALNLGTCRDERTMAEKFRRVVAFAKRGASFYAISLGSVLREPVFRSIIASLLGVAALGAYTIGFRASVVARDSVAGGFGVLYPSLASLHRSGKKGEMAAMQTAALLFLTVLGSIVLGCLYAFAEPLLQFCLGALPAGVVSATRILVVWNLITLFNVPFYYLLQATGHEKASAASLWVHTVAILLLWPLAAVCILDLNGILMYWTITSLATQMLMYYFVEKWTGGFWSVVRQRPVVLTLVCTVLYWAVIIVWTARAGYAGNMVEQSLNLAAVIMPATVVFVVTAAGISWKTMAHYWSVQKGTA